MSGQEQKSSQEITSEKIILFRCAGRPSLGIPVGHTFLALPKSQWGRGGKDLGWMSVEEAQERFGEDNVETTDSSSFCPSCQKSSREDQLRRKQQA